MLRHIQWVGNGQELRAMVGEMAYVARFENSKWALYREGLCYPVRTGELVIHYVQLHGGVRFVACSKTNRSPCSYCRLRRLALVEPLRAVV